MKEEIRFYKKNMFMFGKLRIEHFGNDECIKIDQKLHKTSSNENILGKTTFKSIQKMEARWLPNTGCYCHISWFT